MKYIIRQDKNGRTYARTQTGKPYPVAKAIANNKRSEAVKRNLEEYPRFRDETGKYTMKEVLIITGVRRQEDDFWVAHAQIKMKMGYYPHPKRLERMLNERNPGYITWNPRIDAKESHGPQHFKRESHG